jgi:hypothetical protein
MEKEIHCKRCQNPISPQLVCEACRTREHFLVGIAATAASFGLALFFVWVGEGKLNYLIVSGISFAVAVLAVFATANEIGKDN